MRGGRHTEATLGQLQKSEKGGEEEDQDGEEGIEKGEEDREQDGTSFKLLWTDVRGKLNRMKDEEERIVREKMKYWR